MLELLELSHALGVSTSSRSSRSKTKKRAKKSQKIKSKVSKLAPIDKRSNPHTYSNPINSKTYSKGIMRNATLSNWDKSELITHMLKIDEKDAS